MSTVDKVDLLRSLKSEYAQPRRPRLIDTTPGVHLARTGTAVPGSDAFSAALGDLYAVAYTVKFRSKLQHGRDFAVGKLECRWLGLPETREATTGWDWQMLIRVPDFVGERDLTEAIAVLIEKQKPVSVREVRRIELHEGRCVQMLHVGPYDEEPQTFAEMTAFAAEQGYDPAGAPHEIYLSDPRRVEAAKLKTILRLPVAPRGDA